MPLGADHPVGRPIPTPTEVTDLGAALANVVASSQGAIASQPLDAAVPDAADAVAPYLEMKFVVDPEVFPAFSPKASDSASILEQKAAKCAVHIFSAPTENENGEVTGRAFAPSVAEMCPYGASSVSPE